MRRKFDMEAFKTWLLSNGAEILQPTSEYEALRFKGRHVGVIYTSGKNSGDFVFQTIKNFMNNEKWFARPVAEKRKSYTKQKHLILDRDGDKCFYCYKPMEDDVTLEHLISLVSGGKNTLGNMVLAHDACNQSAGNLTVVEKVNLAIKKRQI